MYNEYLHNQVEKNKRRGLIESRDIEDSTYRGGVVSKSAHLQKRGQTDGLIKEEEETVQELQNRYEEKMARAEERRFHKF